MKTSLLFLLLGYFPLLFFSCESKEPSSDIDPTPQILQEGSSEITSFKSSRYRDDLLEELYSEMAENSIDLKKLENDLEILQQSKDEPYEKFNNYNDKSARYFHSATGKANSIADSLLKKKMLAIIESSEKRYRNITQDYDSLMENISKNDITLKDHYTAMKIILTLPVIEKYQVDKLPDNKDSFKKIIKNQEKIIYKIDSISNN